MPNGTDTRCVRRIWTRNSPSPFTYLQDFQLEDIPAMGVKLHLIFVDKFPLQQSISKGIMQFYDSHGRLDKQKNTCDPVTLLAVQDVHCGGCGTTRVQCFQTFPPGALVNVFRPFVTTCCSNSF